MIGVWIAMAALNAAYMVFLVVGTLAGRLPHGVEWTFSFVINEGMVMLCAVLCWLRARYAQGERLPWAVLGAGIAIYTCGDSYWVLSGLANDLNPPLLSFADLGYTIGTLVMTVGVVLLARNSVARFTPGQWLDGAAATLAVLATACAALLSPIAASSGAGFETTAVDVLYPALDSIVLASTIAVIALTGWRPNIQWWLIAAAALFLVSGDSYYALFAPTYVSGGLIDATWAVAFGLLGTAAVIGRAGVRPAESDAWRMMLMPSAVMVVAVADLAYLALEPNHRPLDGLAVAFAVASVLAGLWRLGYIFRDNARLADARRQALHDPLTGLPNRRLLFERLEDALASGSDVGPRTAVLVIDIDRFKDINDAFGHHAGDQVIEVVAGRLSRSLLPGCSAARMGGDEFVVIGPGMADEAEARRFALRIAGAIREPCDVAGVLIHIEQSVGIALYPDHGDDARLLLSHADAAMYTAKRSGGGVEVYRPESDAPTLERMTLAGEMLDAIASGDIFVVFQPKVDLRTRELAGVEALVRWRHPRRGVLAPGAFIPAAEQGTSLIRSLTLHVLGLSLAQCRLWLGGGHEVPVAVNLSARHLHDPKLPGDVRHLLHQHGVPARLLELEVTETAVMESPERSARTLVELREIGVRIAIDDFGTGESSLRRLQTLPFQVLKIDRSFVSGIAANPGDRAIVETIISLAHAIGVEAVGEGVEDLETLNLLAACGCDIAQGYYLGRPEEASAIGRYLDQPHLRAVRAAV